ncbi:MULTISPECIES: GntR family transcriptional regulator [Bosea]|uniref:GntR family transcriptional regulator n=1 Tax=Bosea TaxID=85413 RepID=UPI00214FA0EC|nr:MULTISPECIES: GntR family transcriptional regulator [Bosea]MCR4522416.1 GntR family transcriptional regulator [Bosea sp. 47.2.35]MDR6829115.1 DNA-binding GntR family transcriptional regulator [Bosea robiniae]MDR6895999.1 DNA-binding GntR family transcriptional regulator [Bosea sp. BE109]MDR7139396.1 DNA-binding GntR family transcriptional regulator [Bosea sp. BE168]MDR7176094.1 DNA-binding GntR family transcriptional regulator [Bosea sp. BE271]
MAAPTRLQQEIAERILQLVRDDALAAGAWLNENATAKRLGVSRTPVRAALDHLAEQGVVRRHLNKGIELIQLPAANESARPPETLDLAMVRLARERENGLLPDEVSELEVMRRYELGRPEAQKLLARLADLDMVERKPGYGWRFLHEPRDQRLRDESYRFRLLIEPMVMLEPGFQLDPNWIAEMRARHVESLQRPWREASSIAFYEMNADFHEGLAAATGNRFFHSAMRRQNQLRRLSNYDWDQGMERVRVNCTEHMAMLDHLEAGENEVASALMRSHLLRASKLRRMSKVEGAEG